MISTQPTKIMGVLNVTPDSFSDGGLYQDPAHAVARAKKMIAEGADCIDIGGESSRPGSDPVSEEEELRRVIPVIEQMRTERISLPISIDTYKPVVARAALVAGASMVNDITGLTNPEMIAVAAEFQVPVVVMHMQGKPKTMQEQPSYQDVVEEVKQFFVERIEAAKKAGIHDLILDPGIGFGKALQHNLLILACLHEFVDLGYPILVGPSRKSFIGALTGGLPAQERLPGTLATVTLAAAGGASWVRVHDVKECRQALQVTGAILSAGSSV